MWLLRLLCALVLAGILTAGLWPFLPPKNQVSWAHDRNGIRFGERGIVYASGPRPPSSPAETDSCAVEIWLQPEAAPEWGSLAVFASSSGYFDLVQVRFALQLRVHNQRNTGDGYRRAVKNVFRPGQPVLIAISSNGKTTNVFVDGVLTQSIDFPLVARNLYGEFQSQDWQGQLFGIATYERALSPADVSRHREAWTSDGWPEPPSGAEVLGMYLFDERGGRIVHNKASLGADLHIPRRYMPNRALLKAERPHLSDWHDILPNIAGFVPLGFLFYAYFSSGRSSPFSALVTVLTGFAISLAIEVSQSFFLPDRISDLVDVVTNTLGTVAGVLLYRIPRVSSAVARLGWRGASARIAPQASDPRRCARTR
jgi:VanZ family protein